MVDRVGQRFGNYRLIRFLGQGGFGDVYLGEHIQNKTWAAVKVLKTQSKNETDLLISAEKTKVSKQPGMLFSLTMDLASTWGSALMEKPRTPAGGPTPSIYKDIQRNLSGFKTA
jgi:serine/threonine protein kinase